ncbi:MAG: hypothetical protein ACQEVT_06990 [Pseudomonadota bacterium]
MIAGGGHMRAQWRGARVVTLVSLLGLAWTAACARESEAALRDRLDQWFAIGDTLAFEARGDCVAAVFRLISADVKAPMPVVSDPMGMLVQLKRGGRAALDSSRQSPDAGLVALANAERATGMAMRRAALEGRTCMDAVAQSAFRAAIEGPRSVLAYDGENGTVMMLDPVTGLLVVAMGAP